MPSGGLVVTSANSWKKIRTWSSPSACDIWILYLPNSLLCGHDGERVLDGGVLV